MWQASGKTNSKKLMDLVWASAFQLASLRRKSPLISLWWIVARFQSFFSSQQRCRQLKADSEIGTNRNTSSFEIPIPLIGSYLSLVISEFPILFGVFYAPSKQPLPRTQALGRLQISWQRLRNHSPKTLAQ